MPIYEYVCQSCGEPLEKLQKLSDDALKDCPACGEPALKRKVSAAGFRLSGGGWYETDFKSDGRRNLTADKDGDNKSTGASSGTDNAAAKKPDAAPAKSESSSAETAKPSKPAAAAADKAKPSKAAKSAGSAKD